MARIHRFNPNRRRSPVQRGRGPQPRRRRRAWAGLLNFLALCCIAVGWIAWEMYSPIAADFSGQARVIDGDTIDIHGQRIRLEGIDAPEARQQCHDGERLYGCGAIATSALSTLIGNAPVSCDDRGRDRYGRTLAHCTVNDVEIGRWMVRNGHALAYWRYSWRYGLDEALARVSGSGVWVGDFERPEYWRRTNR